jgi:hypothetical protein
MMMYQQKHFACLLILFISDFGNVSGVDHKIPFPKAGETWLFKGF